MSEISQSLRRQVVARATERCEYCRIPTQGQVATFPVDHIIPRSAGGATALENLALACPRCNGHKWAFETGLDPVEGIDFPLFNPRLDSWEDHFQWSVDDHQITGKSGIGRATIERLKMNAPEIITIRRLLAELGIDPMGA